MRRCLGQRGITPELPTREDRGAVPKLDRALHRRRNLIERCKGWWKEDRRLGTRRGKPAVDLLADQALVDAVEAYGRG